MKKLNKKGFTIVELVIVIAVIAILAAVLVPTFSGIVKKANQSAAEQEALALYKEAYALDLADGKLDGNDGETSMMSSGKLSHTDISMATGASATYTVVNGQVTLVYNNGKYVVTLEDGQVTKTEEVTTANNNGGEGND